MRLQTAPTGPGEKSNYRNIYLNFIKFVLQHFPKGYTAHKANRLLGRKGAFWQQESYDHVVRDANEWQRIVTYVLNNPVKAGLVDRWEKWQWSYCRCSIDC